MKKIVEIQATIAFVLPEQDELNANQLLDSLDLPKKILSANIIDTEIFDDGIDMDKMLKERSIKL